MKKTIIIAIVATILALFAVKATALPKVTVLDMGCGNTPAYIEKIVKENNLELDNNTPISKKLGNFVHLFKHGTFVVEEDEEKMLISVYQGKVIFGKSLK